MKRLLFLALACVVIGCAPVRPPADLPPVARTATLPFLLGINEGPAVPADVLEHYCAYNRDFIVREPVESVADAEAGLATIAACPRVHALWLIEKDDRALAQALARWMQQSGSSPWGIELGNELDVAGLTPEQFGAWVKDARALLRDAGYVGNLIIGGIYSVDEHQPQPFEDYLAPAIAACPDCYIALHWYGDTSKTWRDRVDALPRKVMVTEYGQPSCTPAQDDAQAAYVAEQLAGYAATTNVVAALFYEQNSSDIACDDSDASHLAHYGLRRPDRTYKPVDTLFENR